MLSARGTARSGLLLVSVLTLACSRRAEIAQPDGGAPHVTTRVSRTIGFFEERQAQAKQAQSMHDEVTGDRTKHPGIHTVRLNAASQRRFAQIWWAARYPHGQKPTPRIEIDGRTVRCSVDPAGDAAAGTETDWTDFETRIDRLPPGRYRIIAPLGEVTLDVP